jgi:hypothetical protein
MMPSVGLTGSNSRVVWQTATGGVRRKKGIIILLTLPILLAANPSRAQEAAARKDLQLQDLLSPQLLARYNSQQKYKDRVEVYHQALSDIAGQLRAQLKKMEMGAVTEDLHRMRSLSLLAQQEPARAAASPKDLRTKQVRKLEIHIRQLVATLNDYKLSVPFDYRADFESATRDLEEWRNQLLIQLFGKAAATPRPPE